MPWFRPISGSPLSNQPLIALTCIAPPPALPACNNATASFFSKIFSSKAASTRRYPPIVSTMSVIGTPGLEFADSLKPQQHLSGIWHILNASALSMFTSVCQCLPMSASRDKLVGLHLPDLNGDATKEAINAPECHGAIDQESADLLLLGVLYALNGS